MLLALGATTPVAAIEEQPAPPLLTAVKLELTGQLGEGEVKVLPDGANIPYIVGTSCVGWRLRFTPVSGSVQLEEQMILPAPAVTWPDETNTTIAADGLSARTPIVADASAGVAANSWCVAPGDPRGRHRFVVRHGRRVLGVLTFTVGVPPTP